MVADWFIAKKRFSTIGPNPWEFSFSGVTIMSAISRLTAVTLSLIFFPLLQAQTSGSLTAEPSANTSGQSGGGAKQRPNILFIIMDDVGIDQMQIFSYGGGTPPLTAKT